MSSGAKLCGLSMGLGTLVAGGAGTVLGIAVALSSWGNPEALNPPSGTGLAFAGAAVGGISSLFIGWLMAWNAAALKASGQDVPASSLWGLATGAVLGLSLGPPVCASIGVILGQIGLDQFVNGLIFGLLFGLVSGVLGWQASFWARTFIPAR